MQKKFVKIFGSNDFLTSVILIYIIISSIMAANAGGDFDVYLDASKKLSEYKNIYAPPFAKGLQYLYSVLFALLLIPFTKYVFVTELCWSFLSYLLLYRILILVKRYFNFSALSQRQYRIWLILTLFLSIQFIRYNISMIQVTIFLLWAMFEAINFVNHGKNIWGGILLGLAINIKLMPVLLLPYLFYRGAFKAFFISLITFVFLLYLPSIFIGYNFNHFLLSEWWSVINPANKEHSIETGIGPHSLGALIPVYLMETSGEMDFKRNILNLSMQKVEIVTNIIRLLLLSMSILYLRSYPFIKEKSKIKSFWEISFFILLIPLLLPHQQKYAFLLIMPMVSYLIYFFLLTSKNKNKTMHYFCFYIFLISMFFFSPFYGSDVIGKFLFLLTQHYRALTISTLLIIPISLYCNPLKLQTETN